ncbi:hypothetical protein DASC09_039240 [Saccharomycopsis crataegensis]|uniref:TAFII28-like protein domain-containing protein n=1 Tax=Saccharomycopsis crataegensis TaxID=43959 RepID=A0AAV5QQA6_9ASCO|nr:hypothetical protein DASC09_039240 [Saccharomycopsis crataegensis]
MSERFNSAQAPGNNNSGFVSQNTQEPIIENHDNNIEIKNEDDDDVVEVENPNILGNGTSASQNNNIKDLPESPRSPEKYQTVDDVSDDEKDLAYMYERIFNHLNEDRLLNVLSTKQMIEKEDEASKILQEDDFDVDDIEADEDEEGAGSSQKDSKAALRAKYKTKNKSSFITDSSKTNKLNEEDMEPIPTDLSPITNREKQGLLMKSFNSDQAERYEAYKRSALSKSFFKKISTAVIGQNLTGPSQFAISGLAKYFMMELLEKCKDVYDNNQNVEVAERIVRKREAKFEEYQKSKKQKVNNSNNNIGGQAAQSSGKLSEKIKVQQSGDSIPPPLTPFHVREAFRLYKFENGYPTNNIRDQGDGNGFMFR